MNGGRPLATVFRSAQDSTLLGLLLLPCAALLIAGLQWLGQADAWSGLLVAGLAILPVLLTYSTLWMVTEYQLHADELRVRCGPLRWRIPCRDINLVEPKWSLRAQPALALRRLRLEYRGGRVLELSPLQRERFIALLAARCPQLRQDGEHLLPPQ